MAWKDYFYFQKGDKIAIILLLILISIAGGIYIITSSIAEKDKDIITEDQSELLFDEKEKVTDSLHTTVREKAYPIYLQKLKQGEAIQLNSADTTELKKIPGIGSVYSQRIVKYRNLL
ncbi:MAG: helix-hairpin-helix domain-containing protein [Dysgonomonas sp.]|nr:helix-hairpin-helix domain-containing protein [Dysgonomonas sp.]